MYLSVGSLKDIAIKQKSFSLFFSSFLPHNTCAREFVFPPQCIQGHAVSYMLQPQWDTNTRVSISSLFCLPGDADITRDDMRHCTPDWVSASRATLGQRRHYLYVLKCLCGPGSPLYPGFFRAFSISTTLDSLIFENGLNCIILNVCRGNFCNPTLTTRKRDTILLQYCHTLMLRAWYIRQGFGCNMHPDG